MGNGSNTAKAVVQYMFGSPMFALFSTSLIVIVIVTVNVIFLTETWLDNSAAAVVIMLVGVGFYTQSDYLIPVAEKANDKIVWRLPTSAPYAALTIDDIPLLEQPTKLEEILDVLKENKVTATFMIMSGFDLPVADGGMEEEARKHCRDLLQRAVKEGHELANHLQFDKPAIAMKEDDFERAFEHCDKLLADICGEDSWRSKDVRWWRPASGIWSKHMVSFAEARGYRTVIGNCHPFDAADASRFTNAGYLQRLVTRGCIVIIHDRWHTPATLRKALPKIVERGIQLVTLSTLRLESIKHPGKLSKELKEKGS